MTRCNKCNKRDIIYPNGMCKACNTGICYYCGKILNFEELELGICDSCLISEGEVIDYSTKSSKILYKVKRILFKAGILITVYITLVLAGNLIKTYTVVTGKENNITRSVNVVSTKISNSFDFVLDGLLKGGKKFVVYVKSIDFSTTEKVETTQTTTEIVAIAKETYYGDKGNGYILLSGEVTKENTDDGLLKLSSSNLVVYMENYETDETAKMVVDTLIYYREGSYENVVKQEDTNEGYTFLSYTDGALKYKEYVIQSGNKVNIIKFESVAFEETQDLISLWSLDKH